MFTDPLTEKDQYWLGYIRADGSVRRLGGYQKGNFTFGQTQEHPVVELMTYLDCKNKLHVSDKAGGFYSKNKSYAFTQNKYYERFAELGVKENLREDLYISRHFWRGMIDGDGSLDVYTRNGYSYPNISLCSSITHDLERFCDFIESFGIKRPPVTPSRTLWLSRLTYEPAQYLTYHLYKDQYSANLLKKSAADRIMNWRPKKGSFKLPDHLKQELRSNLYDL